MKVTILWTRLGWVVAPESVLSQAQWKDKEHTKVSVFLRGYGWKTATVLGTRQIEALPEDYTPDQLNEMIVRYGRYVATPLLERVYKGALITAGWALAEAQDLHRPSREALEKFQRVFNLSWSYVSGCGYGFNIARFDEWCKTQGYAEDGHTSLKDFITQRWGADTCRWFQEVILNVDATGVPA